jgi:hypothetical protein
VANTRSREVHERIDRQIARMSRYYADLRAEVEEQRDRAESRGDELTRFESRLQALEREERLRVAELRQKSALRMELRLLYLVLIQQPKLLLRGNVQSKKYGPVSLELVWDPLVEVIEAIPCPECHRPTFALELPRHARLVCPECATHTPGKVSPPRRSG